MTVTISFGNKDSKETQILFESWNSGPVQKIMQKWSSYHQLQLTMLVILSKVKAYIRAYGFVNTRTCMLCIVQLCLKFYFSICNLNVAMGSMHKHLYL